MKRYPDYIVNTVKEILKKEHGFDEEKLIKIVNQMLPEKVFSKLIDHPEYSHQKTNGETIKTLINDIYGLDIKKIDKSMSKEKHDKKVFVIGRLIDEEDISKISDYYKKKGYKKIETIFDCAASTPDNTRFNIYNRISGCDILVSVSVFDVNTSYRTQMAKDLFKEVHVVHFESSDNSSFKICKMYPGKYGPGQGEWFTEGFKKDIERTFYGAFRDVTNDFFDGKLYFVFKDIEMEDGSEETFELLLKKRLCFLQWISFYDKRLGEKREEPLRNNMLFNMYACVWEYSKDVHHHQLSWCNFEDFKQFRENHKIIGYTFNDILLEGMLKEIKEKEQCRNMAKSMEYQNMCAIAISDIQRCHCYDTNDLK